MNGKMRFWFLFVFLINISYSFGQGVAVSGKVSSKADKTTLPGADAVLLRFPDSVLYKGASTDMDGAFVIQSVVPGKYIFKIMFLGFRDSLITLQVTDQPIDVGNIFLRAKNSRLKEVEIVEKVLPTVLKGDTTEYNSGAFKTNPDATAEDLVQKMPGITSQNGKVQAQGEDVKQVLVDGKPFFGDDPNAALKNLPAEVIDKIQVYDKLSDQAQFTGFDDGNSSKTINIVTKPNMRNGTFGKLFAGYGNNDYYKAGGNLNFFNGDRRISLLGLSNNVNQQNFSTEDLLGVTGGSGGQGGGRGAGLYQRGGQGGNPRGGGGNGGFGQGNSAGNFLVNQSGGIATTNSLGLNYADKWLKKMDVTASYFFNNSKTNSDQLTFRQYVLPSDSGQIYNENTTSTSNNTNHRFNLRTDTQLDSSNSIVTTHKLSVQMNNGFSDLTASNYTGDKNLSSTQSNSSSDLTGYNFTNSLLYRHKFHKKGQTFSINVNSAYNQNKGNSYLKSENNFYQDTLSVDSINQYTHLDKDGSSWGTGINYTEPLSKKSLLQFNYNGLYNDNKSDKETFLNDPVSDSYPDRDSSLSNILSNTYQAQSAGAAYKLQDSIVQVTFGASYQWAKLGDEQTFPYTNNFSRTFTGILPNAMVRIIFARKKSLNINYRTSNNPPSVDQLQSVVNNSNPLQLTIGNPDLKQNYQHNLFLRYSAVNSTKSTTFFALLSGTYADAYVTNSTFIADRDTVINSISLSNGVQLTQPVNMNGYYTLKSFVTYGMPINFKKFNLNLNLGISASYTRTPGLINNAINYAESPSGGFNVVISSNISPQLDFTLASFSTLNYTENTLEENLNSNYFNETSTFKFNWIPWKGLVIATDVSYQHNTGLSQGFNEDYYLWNGAIGYKFLKNKAADLRFSVADILNQNKNIQHNTTETYIEDVNTNVLQRYYMLTFTYTLKKFHAKNPGRNKTMDK